MRTQVAIIGAGPSGLLLGQLLSRARASTTSIIEQRRAPSTCSAASAPACSSRARWTCSTRPASAQRLHREGLVHGGTELCFDGQAPPDRHVRRLTGGKERDGLRPDRGHARPDGRPHSRRPANVSTSAENVSVHDFDTANPRGALPETDGPWARAHELECDFIAGCDGFHGVCRASVPARALRTYEKVYPFGWLGVLADVPPVSHELIYANHERGFALCSDAQR